MQAIPSGMRAENIQCTEQAFPEFPNLLFGTSIDKSIQYFDASDYLNKKGFTNYSVDGFLKNYYHPISALVNAYNLDKNRVCILNTEGHTLLDSNLVYLFISYINPDFLAHLNDRIHELFAKGFCVSDTYLYVNANSRLANMSGSPAEKEVGDKEEE